jgi:glutamate-1-semialdehyde aminotransferase
MARERDVEMTNKDIFLLFQPGNMTRCGTSVFGAGSGFPGMGFPSPDMRQNSSNVGPGTAGQSAIALEDVIVIPWNDEAKLIDTLERYGDEIAVVITEPVMCNSGCLFPKQGYLETMRQAERR